MDPDPASLLPQGRSRETKIRRDAQGRWWNGDDPITHVGLVRAFDAWIEVAEDGRYCLSNDINWAYVAIEGAPVRVEKAMVSGRSVVLSLSDGRTESLDPSTLREDAEGGLYCQVRDGKLAARFESHALMGLADHVREDAQGTFLSVAGETLRPTRVDDPLAFPLAPTSGSA